MPYYKLITGGFHYVDYLMLANGKPVPSNNPKTGEKIYYCEQCHREMGYEFILGPVCGKCCRANHRKVTGR